MEAVVHSFMAGFTSLLGLIIVALTLSRLHWRQVACNRQRFIDALRDSADVPPGWIFSPSYIAAIVEGSRERQESIDSLEREIRQILRQMARESARSVALQQQAKRWAHTAKSQRETIRELSALLENDTERIVDRDATEIACTLRSIGISLGLRDWTGAACWCFEAASLIEVKLLRGDCHADTNGDGDCQVCARGGPCRPIDANDSQAQEMEVR
jgi:hypothetical protein